MKKKNVPWSKNIKQWAEKAIKNLIEAVVDNKRKI